MNSIDQPQAAFRRAPPIIKWHAHYRVADLLVFFDIEESVAEIVNRLLAAPSSSSDAAPIASVIGRHSLVKFADFYSAYWRAIST